MEVVTVQTWLLHARKWPIQYFDDPLALIYYQFYQQGRHTQYAKPEQALPIAYAAYKNTNINIYKLDSTKQNTKQQNLHTS